MGIKEESSIMAFPATGPPKRKLSASLVNLMTRLQGNWPVEEGRLKGILQNYQAIFDEVGEERFAVAVEAITTNSSHEYFPSIAEFRGFIPSPKPRFCDKCVDGWVYVKNACDAFVAGVIHDRAVGPCSCRGGMESIRQLGEKRGVGVRGRST